MFSRIAFYSLASISILACSSRESSRRPSALDTDYFQKIWKHFPGTCSSDNRFRTHSTPQDVHGHAVARAQKKKKKSIKILIYSFSDDTGHYSAILNEKAASGVKVEYLMDFKNSFDAHRVFNRVRDNQANMTLLRVPVLRGRRPQDHNKVVIIDDEVVYTGSANYTMNGLVGNYEDMLSLRDPKTVAKFSDEFEETKALSLKACEVFRVDPSSCGRKREIRGFGRDESEAMRLAEIERVWNKQLVHMLWKTEGQIYKDIISDEPRCRELWDPAPRAGSSDSFRPRPKGLFNAHNQPSHRDLPGCLRDPAFREYVDFVAKNERFADGTRVSSVSRPWDYLPKQDNPEVEVYFSPEDNLLKPFLRELAEAEQHGSRAFIYGSPNFITDRNVVEGLRKAKLAGVRIRLFFDWGRAKDEGFGQGLDALQTLGFTWGGDGRPLKGDITYFNNPLINTPADLHDRKKHIGGGAIHSKFMVIGVPEGSSYRLTLVGGSANWSTTAFTSNGENLIVVRNPEVASMYLKNVLASLLAARYAQNIEGAGFQDELSYLSPKVPCLKALLGEAASCEVNGRTWRPAQNTSHLIVVEGAPVDSSRQRVWAWVPSLTGSDKNVAIPFFTHEGFMSGRWVGVIPTQKGWDACFKLFKADNWVLAPDAGSLAGNDEYPGTDNRCVPGHRMALPKIAPVPVIWGTK